ncbi:MAG: nucleotide pyrophosphatase/phosphodiesterase family protein [Planctomycetota bacterium]
MPKLLLINIAGLSTGLINNHPDSTTYVSKTLPRTGTFCPLVPSFPAVTTTVQTSLTTGVTPSEHGIVGNGFYDHEFMKVRFWEQSDRLCRTPRIWDILKSTNPNLKTAILFWQNSIGSNNDLILTPAPIHQHHGGMIQDCYSQPANLYPDLKKRLGQFNLKWYWGPFTSLKSSIWIARATEEVLKQYAPDLVLTYLPHLDYNQQRWGPSDSRMKSELKSIDDLVGSLSETALKIGYEVMVVSDYAMTDVKQTVMINQVLRKNGFLKVRRVKHYEYLDVAASRAFAVVDHQIAHIYIGTGDQGRMVSNRFDVAETFRSPNTILSDLKKLLERIPGIEKVLDPNEQKEWGINHPRSGELIAVARSDAWFAYPWWFEAANAPDYARHVDIHNKPGYDPLELFWDWRHLGISTNTGKIKGSHGRTLAPGHQPPATFPLSRPFHEKEQDLSLKTNNPIFSSTWPVKLKGTYLKDTDVLQIIKESL